jgi:signal transduction histidine kinase
VGSLFREITLSPPALLPLAGALLQLALAVFLILSPGDRALRWAFALMAVCAASWSFFTAVALSTTSPEVARGAVQISLAAVACAGPTAFEFATRLVRASSRWVRPSQLLGLAVAVTLLVRPSLVVVIERPGGGYWPTACPGFELVLLTALPSVVLAMVTVARAAGALPPSRRRRQLSWAAAALALGGFSAVDAHTVFDHGYPIQWLTSTLSCATLFYAVVQYRLMAIRTVLQRLLVLLLAGTAFAGWLVALALFYRRLTPALVAAWVLAAFAGMRLWSAQVEPFLARLFDARRRRLERAFTEFERGALEARSTDDVIARLSRTIEETLGAQLVSLVPGEVLPLALRDLVDLDTADVLAALDRHKADALVPLPPAGMAALAGGALTAADDELADLLGRLGEAAGRAFTNAHLYEEVERRSAGLGEEVKRRTAQLEAALAELTAAQSKLAEAERSSALGLLVAGVSHEVNNALNFISANLPSLSRYLATYRQHLAGVSEAPVTAAQADASERVAGLEAAVRRTKAIVDDLRKFARPDAERRLLQVTEGLDAALNLLRRRTDGRLDVVREYAGAGLVEGYPGPLNQCFFNLLLNAVEAAHSEICVLVKEGESGVEVVISDDGDGIPEDLGEQVFRPFFSTRPKAAGLGLGVSRAIVERHGGTLRIGQAAGGGARVEVRLPSRAPEVAT